MDRYSQKLGRREVPLSGPSRPRTTHAIDYCSLVDPRIRPLMYSRRLDSGYRTDRPIFTYLGPIPDSLALASQDVETLRIFAASFGCTSFRFRTMEGVCRRVRRKIPGHFPQNCNRGRAVRYSRAGLVASLDELAQNAGRRSRGGDHRAHDGPYRR
jgi:hypothetical protein